MHWSFADHNVFKTDQVPCRDDCDHVLLPLVSLHAQLNLARAHEMDVFARIALPVQYEILDAA